MNYLETYFTLAALLAAVFCHAGEENTKIIAFQGKGSSIGWDLGAISALERSNFDISETSWIVSGNSSGAIPSALFGCEGINESSINPHVLMEPMIQEITAQGKCRPNFPMIIELLPLASAARRVCPLLCRTGSQTSFSE